MGLFALPQLPFLHFETLLGAGASQDCAANSVVGGADRFTTDAHIAHALLVLNGICARTSSGLQGLRYALVRAIGRALGLDWSQLNDHVITGSPSPTADDSAGFPIMHPEPALCSISYGCAYNADQLRMDDRAAVSRLYQVTADNLAQFPGKSALAASTARIHGRTLFPDADHAAMQGVNVVARYIDPATGSPSHAVTPASVSGFLFRGNAGNNITGFTGATGERFEHWGSSDPALRGAYDLAGLEIPAGSSTAPYQLTVKPMNSAYTGALSSGPCKLSQIKPSRTSVPLVITVTRGGDVLQNIAMQGAASGSLDRTEPHSFAQPAAFPAPATRSPRSATWEITTGTLSLLAPTAALPWTSPRSMNPALQPLPRRFR